MKKLLVAGIAAAAFCGAPAIAAEIPTKAPVYKAAASMFNWSGFYAGLNAGYSWGRTTVDYTQDAAGFGSGSGPVNGGGSLSQRLSPNSFIGGGQLGYNYQAGAWVLGIETDIGWRHRQDSASILLNIFSDVLTLRDTQDWVGTVRGRIGMTTASNWLIYATGGLAYGELKHSVTQFCNGGCAGPPPPRTFSDSTIKTGWTVGGGAEVALNRNWSLGAEYLYLDFGTHTLTATATPAFPNTTASFHDRSHVVRAKLNYKFN